MKRFSEQFKKKADSIRLSTSEKDVLRERITAYMAYHPLPVSSVEKTKTKAPLFKEPFIEWAIPSRFYKQLVLGSFVFMLVGVPFLAERSVPGDVLYPMKVRVNEEVRASLTSGGYEKVVWETKRLERRIAEARLLAKEGRLTPEIEAGVIAAVNEHQVAAAAEIAELRAIDADGAALAELTVVSVLDVQSAALRAGDTASTTEGMSTVAIALAVDEAQAKVAQASGDTVSYERLVAQLEQETTRGRELLLSIKSGATEQEYTDIERRLADIERKVALGMSLYGGDSTQGMESLTQTWRDMQTIITFMTDIDVRNSLVIDVLVPVVLTPEEEKVLALQAYDEANQQLAIIMEMLPTVSDTGISDKVALTVPQVVTLLETASSSLETDTTLAQRSAEEAREYTRSIMSLAVFSVPVGDETAAMMTTLPATSTASTTDEATSTSPVATSTERAE